MKNGATSLKVNEGMISANSTTPFGVAEPTRSTAAERIMTYKMLLSNPNIKNDVKIFVWCSNDIIVDDVAKE